MQRNPYLSFWGKAGGVIDDQPLWHPVAYHSLDVAVVADALLAANPRKLGVMARLLGTSTDNARRFLVCLVALHDVGKFSQHFQAKSQEAWLVSVEQSLGPWKIPPTSRHDADGYDLRDPLALRNLFLPSTEEWINGDFNTIWAAITGHHGQPRNDNGRKTSLIAGMTPTCQSAATAFSRDVRALFDPLDALPEPNERDLKVLSWLICGLTVVSDWIGSNRAWFPYRHPTQTLAEYWDYARLKATEAVNKAGVLPSKLPACMTAERLLPEIATTLTHSIRRSHLL